MVKYMYPACVENRFKGLERATHTIQSDVTGIVWKIVVQVGEALQADDTIIVPV